MNTMESSDQNGPQRQDDRRRVAVVTTTVRVPRFLAAVLEHAQTYGHGDQVILVVIGDRKTPPAVADFVADLGRRHRIDAIYLDWSVFRDLWNE